MPRSAASLAWRAVNRFFQHNGPDRAAAVAYYTLLSLLPLLIFLISLGAAVVGSFDEAYRGTLFLLRGIVVHLDESSLATLRAFVERSQRFRWPGILILAWTSKRSIGALLGALETVFEVKGRSIARGNLVSLALVFLLGLGVLATLLLTTLLAALEGMVLRFAGAGGASVLSGFSAVVVARVVPVGIAVVFFYTLYRLVPGGVIGRRAAWAGALLATALWELAKAAFAFYIRNLAHYAGLYGALEAVIVLGLWLELSVSIVLLCAEVIALLVAAPTPAA